MLKPGNLANVKEIMQKSGMVFFLFLLISSCQKQEENPNRQAAFIAELYNRELIESILTTKRSIENQILMYPQYAASAENAQWLDTTLNAIFSEIDSLEVSIPISEQQEKIFKMSLSFRMALKLKIEFDVPDSLRPVFLQYASENRALKETSKTWFLMVGKEIMSRIRLRIGGSCCFFCSPQAEFNLAKKDKNSVEFDVSIPKIDCGLEAVVVDSMWKDGIPIKAFSEGKFEKMKAHLKINSLKKGHYIMKGRVLRQFDRKTNENPFGVQFDF